MGPEESRRSATISARQFPATTSARKLKERPYVPRLDTRAPPLDHLRERPETDIYIGYSRNFTIERVLHSRFGNTQPVQGNDITAYSCALGWLAPYMGAFAGRLATLMLGIVEAHLTDLQAGYTSPQGEPLHTGQVGLETVFGARHLPAPAAVTINKAIAAAEGRGEIEQGQGWRLLERLAGEYLSGPNHVPSEPA
ncbi:hypothetical protein ACNPQM_43335 [Streptomyces sp. NPDC056231]|uniref:putative antirestriction adenine methyltransferase n=1 Tax=Streptomyces sp. NPDC056231 TaxID=3345755 RepID=UPI003AADBDEA